MTALAASGWNRRAWWQSPSASILAAKWLCVVLLIVRLIAVFRFQHDIDESQNLHVVYGWLSGELPYRDRFDNHAPLFAWMFAPLAWLVGENANVVIFARLALLPFGLGALALIFLIAKRVADRETAWWTMAICLALADWSLKSLEFRPDVIWALLWFAALWVIVRNIECLGVRTAVALGLLLGLALMASIKTTLLVPSLALACLTGVFLSPVLKKQFSSYRWVWFGLVVFVSFLIPPALGIGALLIAGTTLEQIRFCLFEVNQAPLELWRLIGAGVVFLLALVSVAWIFRRDDARRAAVGILLLTAGTYLALLLALAPELRKQTFLVVYPLVILLALYFSKSAGALLPAWRLAVSIVCVAAMGHLLVEAALWRDGMDDQRLLLSRTLALTDRGEMLLDGRGETVFADRPVYLAFVAVTTAAVEDGNLDSPDMSALTRHPTAVAIGELDGLPRAVRNYLKENFVLGEDGLLRVSGQLLEPSWEDGRWIERINVALPGSYVVIKDDEIVGHLDVKEPGMQILDFGTDRSRRFLIWRDAWSDGFRPRKQDG
ncbi:MAG: ArnT family glycosyltransferase [Chthoniobacterales bacterium]